jgi:hypothetical protein
MSTELTSMVSDIVVGLSALFVALVAFKGLQTWRRELTGKAKFEIARSLMSLALKLSAGFKASRDIFTFSGESTDRSRQENESSNVSQVLDEWYARSNRLKPLHENLIKIQEASWEAEILLEENASRLISEATKQYISSYAELSSAIYSYFDTRRHEAVTGNLYHDQDWMTGLHKLIYSAGTDDFSKRVDETTDNLKQALRTYVR